MIFVILPAFNEAACIEDLIKRLDLILSDHRKEIVLVDDGSKDNTVWLAKHCGVPVTIIEHPKNMGLGPAMLSGLKYVISISNDDDLIVTMDADFTHQPIYLKKAIEKIKDYDVVILSRYHGGWKLGLSETRSIASLLVNMTLKTCFNIPGVLEYTCNFRVMRSSSILKVFASFKSPIELLEWGFVASTELLVKLRATGARITETPFTLCYNMKSGKSKMNVKRTLMGYLRLILHGIG